MINTYKSVEETKTPDEFLDYCQVQDVRTHLARLEHCFNQVKAELNRAIEKGDDREMAEAISDWLDAIKREAATLQEIYGDGF